MTAHDASGGTTAPDFPHTRLSRVLDSLINRIGSLSSWLWVLIIIATVANVVWRYALSNNIGQLEELQWHLFAVAFLVGIAYCIPDDSHIRVDMLYAGLSLKARGWIELIGLLAFALPFVVFVIVYAVPFVEAAWAIGERSDQPSGLPHRFLIKGALIAGFGLIAIALLSRLSRVTALLFGLPRAEG